MRRIWQQLRILMRRDRFRNELEEEMVFHRAEAESAFVSEGMSGDAARYAARRQFGNATRLQERSHEAVSFRAETVWQDAGFAMRQLRRNPGFALTAVLVLALGFCANVTIFAFADAALLKPLPYPNPSRLVGVFSSIAAGPMYCLSYLDYLDWKRSNKVFDAMEAYETSPLMLETPKGGELARGVHVTDGFFRTLGVAPALGRDFYAGEDRAEAPRAVLLSYATWQKRYGGRANALGQTVTLDGVPNTIVGVLPKDFRFAPAEPAEFFSTLDPAGGCEKRRICHNLFGIARLKEGVSVQMAQDNLAAIARQLEKQYPDSNRGQGAVVYSMTDVIVGDVRPLLLALFCGTGLLLGIACVNVASLLLMRSERRRHEIALRGALGASPVRLVRQFATEGALLAGSGGVLGFAGALAAVHVLPRLLPVDMLAGMPYLRGLGWSLHLAGYGLVIMLLAWALFAAVPMLRLPLGDLRRSLSEDGRGAASTVWRRFGSSFVVLELATAILLLAGAGLLTKSVYRLLHVDTGMRADHLAVLSLGSSNAHYGTEEQSVELGREVERRMEALPGVRAVGITTSLPLRGFGPFFDFVVQGRPMRNGDHEEATLRQVNRTYLATLGARLLRGRSFATSDTTGTAPVGVINRSFARRFFPGEDPLGKRIEYTGPARPAIEVVGVIDDIKEGDLNADSQPAFYVLFDQAPAHWFSVVARTAQDEESLLPLMVQAIHQVYPDIAVYEPGSMQQIIRNSPTTYLHRSSAWLASGFAGMALLLSVIGLYGVIAYSVSQRTREIGVRMALGAQRSTVYRLVLGEAWRLILLGIVAGIAGSLATTTLLRPLLFGVRPWDVATLVAVAGLLGTAAMLASYLPAHRAASIDPTEALRAE